MASPLRTLTFGDRTFSYDTGLNCVSKPGVEGRFASRVAREEREGRELEREDSVRSTTSDSGAGSDYSEECEEGEEGRRKKNEEGGEVRRKSSAVGRRRWSNIEGDEGRWAREEEGDRKLIQPDLCAISQLLNFDEEEENGLTSEEEEEEGAEEKKRWRSAMVKDLTTRGRSGLTRRHSITLRHSLGGREGVQGKVEEQAPPPLPTLDLNLEEVAHIRSVLTRAELEALPLDTGVKAAVEAARLCFLCLTTRFGLFTRGTKCQVCRQTVCSRCCARMRIPVEQFNSVPVEMLAPTPDCPSSLPPLLSNCAGSAPSSPKPGGARDPSSPKPGGKGGARPAPHLAPLAPPPVTSVYNYSTLPRRAARRWSMISTWREAGREKLEGSMLAVCTDCRSMVLQVIRSQGRSRRCRRGQRREECGL